jgi:hypothetical protein
MASQTPIPQTPIPPGAMIPMQQQRPPSFAAKVCSYCLGDPAGGPDGHLYRSCLLFLTGQQSRNPKWNYAASGPANFLAPGQAGNLPGNSMMPMPVNQHLYRQAQVQQLLGGLFLLIQPMRSPQVLPPLSYEWSMGWQT